MKLFYFLLIWISAVYCQRMWPNRGIMTPRQRAGLLNPRMGARGFGVDPRRQLRRNMLAQRLNPQRFRRPNVPMSLNQMRLLQLQQRRRSQLRRMNAQPGQIRQQIPIQSRRMPTNSQLGPPVRGMTRSQQRTPGIQPRIPRPMTSLTPGVSATNRQVPRVVARTPGVSATNRQVPRVAAQRLERLEATQLGVSRQTQRMPQTIVTEKPKSNIAISSRLIEKKSRIPARNIEREGNFIGSTKRLVEKNNKTPKADLTHVFNYLLLGTEQPGEKVPESLQILRIYNTFLRAPNEVKIKKPTTMDTKDKIPPISIEQKMSRSEEKQNKIPQENQMKGTEKGVQTNIPMEPMNTDLYVQQPHKPALFSEPTFNKETSNLGSVINDVTSPITFDTVSSQQTRPMKEPNGKAQWGSSTGMRDNAIHQLLSVPDKQASQQTDGNTHSASIFGALDNGVNSKTATNLKQSDPATTNLTSSHYISPVHREETAPVIQKVNFGNIFRARSKYSQRVSDLSSLQKSVTTAPNDSHGSESHRKTLDTGIISPEKNFVDLSAGADAMPMDISAILLNSRSLLDKHATQIQELEYLAQKTTTDAYDPSVEGTSGVSVTSNPLEEVRMVNITPQNISSVLTNSKWLLGRLVDHMRTLDSLVQQSTSDPITDIAVIAVNKHPALGASLQDSTGSGIKTEDIATALKDSRSLLPELVTQIQVMEGMVQQRKDSPSVESLLQLQTSLSSTPPTTTGTTETPHFSRIPTDVTNMHLRPHSQVHNDLLNDNAHGAHAQPAGSLSPIHPDSGVNHRPGEDIGFTSHGVLESSTRTPTQDILSTNIVSEITASHKTVTERPHHTGVINRGSTSSNNLGHPSRHIENDKQANGSIHSSDNHQVTHENMSHHIQDGQRLDPPVHVPHHNNHVQNVQHPADISHDTLHATQDANGAVGGRTNGDQSVYISPLENPTINTAHGAIQISHGPLSTVQHTILGKVHPDLTVHTSEVNTQQQIPPNAAIFIQHDQVAAVPHGLEAISGLIHLDHNAHIAHSDSQWQRLPPNNAQTQHNMIATEHHAVDPGHMGMNQKVAINTVHTPVHSILTNDLSMGQNFDHWHTSQPLSHVEHQHIESLSMGSQQQHLQTNGPITASFPTNKSELISSLTRMIQDPSTPADVQRHLVDTLNGLLMPSDLPGTQQLFEAVSNLIEEPLTTTPTPTTIQEEKPVIKLLRSTDPLDRRQAVDYLLYMRDITTTTKPSPAAGFCPPFEKTVCQGKGQYEKLDSIPAFCDSKCGSGECPTDMCDCRCVSSLFVPKVCIDGKLWCSPTTKWKAKVGMDNWCFTYCSPFKCDTERCECSCLLQEAYSNVEELLLEG